MKLNLNGNKLISQANIGGLAVMLCLAGCGSADTDPGATASESPSELAAASVSGAISATNPSGASAMLESRTDRMLAMLDQLLSPKNAFAATTCPTVGASLSACSSGTDAITLNSCNYLKPDGVNFYAAVFNGTLTYKFADLNAAVGSQAYCPALGAFPLSTSGTGSAFGASGVSFTKTSAALTKTSGDGKTVVTIDTATPSGWDTSVGSKSGGTTVTFASAGNRTIMMNGIHYTAVRSYTTKKGVAKTATVWDHTVSTSTALTNTFSGGVHTTNGTVVLQHNLAKYTASASFANVTHSHSSCGCLPNGGVITTSFTGSKTGNEILTVTGCGTATLQLGTTLAAAQAATTTNVTLTHCQ